jgi:putative peptidoglycan lipid II flippase
MRCSWALSAFSLGLPSYVLVKVLTPGYYARHDTRTPVRYAVQSVGVNLAGNLILIPLLGRYGYGHVGPPLATALASTMNVWMLYHTLKKRGHFETDPQLRRRVPRLALASLIMGGALFWLTPAVDPYLTGTILRRAAGLTALVGAGAAIYAIACFLTGAFALDDVKLLMKRRAKEA